MKKLIKGLWSIFKESRKALIILFLILIGFFFAGNILFYVASHFPKSCTVCHFMEPYYQQWKTSSHNKAICLECHPYRIPFITVTTLKYLTKTYNPRPHANVRDKSCLQNGCHDKRLIKSKASLKGGIFFDHKLHWGIKKRGKELRCTSCHYQMVQGGHFAVDKKVCFLCHFKGIRQGRSLTGCLSCHGTPTKGVEHEGFTFTHSSYLKKGVKCEQCHLEVTSGTGSVPEEKCHYCHLPREERIMEVDFLHDKHITQNGYECLQCHSEIKHGQIRMIQALEVSCQNCHTRLHSRQKEIFMGTGGKGLDDIPSRMFSAQVTCDGCHIKEAGVVEAGVLASQEKSLKAVRESCVICHGAGYDKMLDDWIAVMDRQVKHVEPYLLKAEKMIKNARRKDIEYEKALFLVQDARENFDLSRIGRPAHNVEYSVNLLKSALDQVTQALSIVEKKTLEVPSTDVLNKGNSYCLALCHSRIGMPPKIKIEKQNLEFPHLIHAEQLSIQCTDCHSKDKHRTAISSGPSVTETQGFLMRAKTCDRCHGEGFTSILAQLGKDEQMKFPGKCSTCHQNVEKISKQVFGLEFSHKNHSERKLSCRRCHTFVKQHGETNVTKENCASCHHQEAPKNCQNCHINQYNIYWGKVSFMGLKGDIDPMAQAEVSCTDCHDLARKDQIVDAVKEACVGCHEESYDVMLMDWEKELQTAMAEVQVKIKAANAVVEARKKGGQPVNQQVLLLLKEASSVSEKMELSTAIHNFEFASQVLKRVKIRLDEASSLLSPK